MVEWLELLMLPNLGLILTLLTIMIAAYISWSEEVTGEDGMVLDNEESSEEVDKRNAGEFRLETSIDDGEEKPKYFIFAAWKWLTILYQISFIVQLIVIVLWGLEDLVPTTSDKNETKTEVKEDKENVKEVDETQDDILLHVLPLCCLVIEWLTNSQVFIMHHYAIIILFTVLIPNLGVTIFLELITDKKLYMLDISPVEYIHIPAYPVIAVVISFPLFFVMELLTNMKLKRQGYPCDKILYELEEFRKSKRATERESERLNSKEPEGGELERIYIKGHNLNFSHDESTAVARDSA